MNQHKYIQDLITLAGLEDTSSVDTPMEVNVKYRKDEGTFWMNLLSIGAWLGVLST